MSKIAQTRAIRASLAGLMLLVLFPSPATATHWAPTSYSVALTTAPNYRTAGDSFYVRAIFSWNSSAAQTMRNYAQQNGYRFTSDARDLSCCVHAQWNRYSTTLPNPVYDADDDDGNLVYEEAELTANSSTFPTAGTSYNTYLKFSRWFPACNDYFCTEYWEAGPGTMRQIGQMSQYIWPEWDSVGFTDLVMGDVTYPYKAPPSGAAAQEVAAPEGDTPPSTTAVDAFVEPDLSRGLDPYAAEARAAAVDLLHDGQGAQGIATFSRPLSTDDLAELERAGLEILFVEAIATGPGPRVTVGSPYSSALDGDLAELVALQDATLDGVTSATVVVHSARQYEQLSQDARVYLIDLSLEAARRADPGADVVMNDLYWVLMGWE